jgi:hypothetical protein
MHKIDPTIFMDDFEFAAKKALKIIFMLLVIKVIYINNSEVCGQARDKFHLAARRKKSLKKLKSIYKIWCKIY